MDAATPAPMDVPPTPTEGAAAAPAPSPAMAAHASGEVSMIEPVQPVRWRDQPVDRSDGMDGPIPCDYDSYSSDDEEECVHATPRAPGAMVHESNPCSLANAMMRQLQHAVPSPVTPPEWVRACALALLRPPSPPGIFVWWGSGMFTPWRALLSARARYCEIGDHDIPDYTHMWPWVSL